MGFQIVPSSQGVTTPAMHLIIGLYSVNSTAYISTWHPGPSLAIAYLVQVPISIPIVSWGIDYPTGPWPVHVTHLSTPPAHKQTLQSALAPEDFLWYLWYQQVTSSVPFTNSSATASSITLVPFWWILYFPHRVVFTRDLRAAMFIGSVGLIQSFSSLVAIPHY